MKNFTDKEYHPVIEDYISDYADEKLELAEREAFEEVLVHDDDLRELAFSAKEGKKLLEGYMRVVAAVGFEKRLFAKLDRN